MYLSKLGNYPKKPIVSESNLREVLGSVPAKSFSTRINIYSAVMSFAKYLEVNQFVEPKFRDKLRTLRPKRFYPAKKTVLTEIQIKKLIDSIRANFNRGQFDRFNSEVIVRVLANTGLRSSEFCNLKLEDVDLESRKIFVKLGKGNKDRVVGISSQIYDLLFEYMDKRLGMDLNHDNFFVNKLLNPFNKETLSKKVHKLGLKAGFDISPHSLRRSFVTINLNKGRPIVHLQIACGHSEITTTRSYCMTSQDEVISAMQKW
jgi:integrase